MEITQLQYFVEVAESEHITQSAEKLHIAQPALTQAIKRLEHELGVPLFTKDGRNIVITKYGQYLKDTVEPFLETLNKIPYDIAQLQNAENSTIYINVLAASTLITNAIIKFQSEHDDAKIKLTQNSEQKLFDIEVTTRPSARHNDKSNDLCSIFPEQIFLAVPNIEKYAGLDSIRLVDIDDEGFVSLMGSRQFRNICDRFCRHAGIRPNYIFESDSPTAVQNMIAANIGVGFWPEFSWGKIQNKKIKLLSIADTICGRDLIVTLNKNGHNNIAKEFFGYLNKYLQHEKSAATGKKTK